MHRYRRRLMAEISVDELQSSGSAVGSGPGIKAQFERAQRDKAEVLLERWTRTHRSCIRAGTATVHEPLRSSAVHPSCHSNHQ